MIKKISIPKKTLEDEDKGCEEQKSSYQTKTTPKRGQSQIALNSH